jgi:inner membrane protein
MTGRRRTARRAHAASSGPPIGSRICGPRRPATVLVALLLVPLLDLVQWSRPWPVPLVGLLDEPAHLLTAWLFLASLPWRSSRRLPAWTLAGAVAIDLDHIPLYLGWEAIGTPGGRPVTHSLLTVGVLLVVAGAPRFRVPALGVGFGVLLHLVRDLATGPGVPLYWPLSEEAVVLPYAVEFAALTVAAIVAVRARRRRVVSGRAI